MRDINLGGVRLRLVSSSTVARLRTGHIAEADGVLQMLRWLGRAPESFVQGSPPIGWTRRSSRASTID